MEDLQRDVAFEQAIICMIHMPGAAAPEQLRDRIAAAHHRPRSTRGTIPWRCVSLAEVAAKGHRIEDGGSRGTLDCDRHRGDRGDGCFGVLSLRDDYFVAGPDASSGRSGDGHVVAPPTPDWASRAGDRGRRRAPAGRRAAELRRPPKTCGGTGDDSCCASALVPGGSFFRATPVLTQDEDPLLDAGFDQSHAATVSTFRLDKYVVTGCFSREIRRRDDRRLVPRPPARASTRISTAAGFGSAPTAPRPRPAGATASAISRAPTDWTTLLTADDCHVPVTTWSEDLAQSRRCRSTASRGAGGRSASGTAAFCQPDAEYNYAAMGGDEERTYAWSNPPDSGAIDWTYASYGAERILGAPADACLGDPAVGRRPAPVRPSATSPSQARSRSATAAGGTPISWACSRSTPRTATRRSRIRAPIAACSSRRAARTVAACAGAVLFPTRRFISARRCAGRSTRSRSGTRSAAHARPERVHSQMGMPLPIEPVHVWPAGQWVGICAGSQRTLSPDPQVALQPEMFFESVFPQHVSPLAQSALSLQRRNPEQALRRPDATGPHLRRADASAAHLRADVAGPVAARAHEGLHVGVRICLR